MTIAQVQPRELPGLEEIAFDPARLPDDGWVSEIREALRQRYGFIVKNVVEPGVLDRIVEYGELIHGVAPVDPDEPLDWLSFQGRWVMLGAIIKTAANTASPNALQVGG